ncbi:legume-like lectin family-domain-containing protein [Limtongia smithiae]|uniref:legume-like lectin family-domain-containing protein n=1 Tax=Limtongia smithiae TaxID=1125753 RepID=UPI0034CE519D
MKFLSACFAVVFLLASPARAAGAAVDDNFPNGVKRVPLRTHSLRAPYLDDSLHSRWYDYGGDTVIRTDKYVRLTADRPSQTGQLYSRLPLTAANFEVIVDFKISGKGNLYGDGMAIWVTKERNVGGTVFGAPDFFNGLGILIDTYKNNRPGVTFPYIMAVMGDGQTRYSKEDDGKPNELAGCSARGLHNSQSLTRLRITYVTGQFLEVDLEFKEPNKWTECFRVNNPPQLPPVAYLGFTAETGELSENHDIVSIDVNTLFITGGSGPASSPAAADSGSASSASTPPMIQQGRKKKGSWFGFIFKSVLKLLLVGGAGYIGYKRWLIYAKTRKESQQVLF